MKKKKVLLKRSCMLCGKSFIPFRAWAKYCSAHCRIEAWRQRNPRIPLEELERLRAKCGEGGVQK